MSELIDNGAQAGKDLLEGFEASSAAEGENLVRTWFRRRGTRAGDPAAEG